MRIDTINCPMCGGIMKPRVNDRILDIKPNIFEEEFCDGFTNVDKAHWIVFDNGTVNDLNKFFVCTVCPCSIRSRDKKRIVGGINGISC